MGIEPTTPALRKRCTTAVLPWPAAVHLGLLNSRGIFKLLNGYSALLEGSDTRLEASRVFDELAELADF
jgi:hypothetical protein